MLLQGHRKIRRHADRPQQMETLRDRRKACVGMSRCRYWLKLLGTPELLGKLKRAG